LRLKATSREKYSVINGYHPAVIAIAFYGKESIDLRSGVSLCNCAFPLRSLRSPRSKTIGTVIKMKELVPITMPNNMDREESARGAALSQKGQELRQWR